MSRLPPIKHHTRAFGLALLMLCFAGCDKEDDADRSPASESEPAAVTVVSGGGGGGSSGSNGASQTTIKIPVAVEQYQNNAAAFALFDAATAFSISLANCGSGYTATVTQANTDGLEVLRDDRNCLAKLTQFTLNGKTYYPTSTDPFTTWQHGNVARFDEFGEPGIAPLYVSVVSTLSSPINIADVIKYGLADKAQGDGRGILSSTVGVTKKYKTDTYATPSFTVRSIALADIDSITGAGQFRFVLECTSDIGATSTCAGVDFSDMDYKLVKDDYSDVPSAAQCDDIFATPGTGITLPGDVVAPGALATTNGGFKTITLNGPADLATNSHALLVIRSYGVSYQFFNIDTVVSADFHGVAGPAVANVTTAHENGAYTIGEVIDIDVTFDRPLTTAGTAATLTLNSGGTAVFFSKPAAATLRYRYTVLATHGAADLDVSVYNFNGDVIQDELGRAATNTLPSGVNTLAASADIAIDTVTPTIVSVTTAHANGTFPLGEAIDVDVTFNDPVTVTTATSTLAMNTGGTAYFQSAPSSTVLRYRYTVLAGESTGDLNVTSYDLNGDVVQNAAGTAADLTLPSGLQSLAGSAAIVIDALAPVITNVTSSTANGGYATGSVLSIQVTYSRSVFLAGTSPGATLLLETGSTDHSAVYVSGSGTATLSFNYTVIAGDGSADLDTNAAAPQLTLTGTTPTLKDAVGNPASRTVAGTSLATNKNLVIDTTTPTITSITTSHADGTFGTGEIVDIDVTFSGAVTLTGTGSKLQVSGGGLAVYRSKPSPAVIRYRYTVLAGETAADLDVTAYNLFGDTIRNAVGTNADLTLPSGAQSLAGGAAIVIDASAPAITNITSATANGAYGTGSVVSIQVTYDKAVNLAGTSPGINLLLETGTTDRSASYVSGSGTVTLNFNYTVVSGDASADLTTHPTAPQLTLTGTGPTLKDGYGNTASLNVAGTTLATNKDIVIDTTIPTITSVSTAHANGTFTAGEVIDIDVTFSASVTLTGTASTLSMNTGGTAYYLSKPSASVIRYRYTVLVGTTSSDLDVTALNLNGDTIRNVASTDADLTLPGGASSLAGSAAIVIDTIGPVITNISSSTANGTYVTGQVISIQVTYNENVILTGTTPGITLKLETGTTDRNAVYVSGNGTSILNFNYTVVAGDASSDLNTHASAPQFTLTGTAPTLRDAVGNDGSMTVTGTNLSTNKNIVIDALAPAITNITSSTANASYTTASVISIQVTWSEPVILAGTSPGINFKLETGTTDRNAVYTSGSGTATLNFNYTVVATDTSADLDGNATAPQFTLSGTTPTLKDAAGNAASLTVAGTTLAANKDLVIDTTAPAITNITSTATNGSYTTGAVIPIQVTYSEAVTLAGTSPGITLKLETGTTDHLATYTSGSGTNTLQFSFTVVAGDTSADLATNATAPQFVLTGTTPTLKDAAGNSSSLTVAGTTLATNKNIVVDTAAPPALTTFSGVACCVTNTLKANGIELTIKYPATITDYSNVKIRRVAGATAPADCTSGSLITTINGPFTASATTKYTDDTGTAGVAYSYRACVTDAVGITTSTNTALNIASAKFSWIFATSTNTYTGNLTSVANADSICTTAGSALDGSLNWVALLSTGSMNAAGHAPVRGSVYNRASTPVAVATNFTTMWAGTWATAVTYDETGTSTTGNVWTGSLNTGVADRGTSADAINNHCANWTSASAGSNGRYGSVTGTGTSWAELGTQACDTTSRIYCVSKTIEPLVAFSAATGTTTDGNINVTVTFPADTTNYTKVEIRRKSGATAPSNACTTDVLVKTYNTAPYTSETFVDPTATNAGAYFSYTACLYDANGRVAVTTIPAVRAYSSTPSHLLFATTSTFTGNLGGLTGGDAICQGRGNRFDPTKTWKLLASSSTVDAVTRVGLSGNVRNVNGVLLATSSADFFDGTLAAAVSLTEDGVASTNYSWTGSANTGIKKGAGLYCADWTNSTNATNGRRGRHSTTTTHLDFGTTTCNTALSLYCISSAPY